MPPDTWLYDDVYNSLGWDKAKTSTALFSVNVIIVAFLLLFPLYFLLKPLYIHINNPYFLTGYISIIAITFFYLYRYDKNYLNSLLNKSGEDSILHHLQPAEVIYLKIAQTADIIHNSVNSLVEQGEIEVAQAGTLRITGYSDIKTAEEFAIKESIGEAGGFHYRILLKQMASKAIFSNTVFAMKELQKRFRQSKAFGRLFRINFIAFTALFLPGVIRLITGIERGKPVGFLFFAVLLLFVFITGGLARLSKYLFTDIIPG